MAVATPWWKKPLVILAQGYDTFKTLERDPARLDKLVRFRRRAGFDAEHLILNLSMFDGKGGEDSRAYLYKNFHHCQEDWLSVYLPIAQKHGLRIVVYFNCHWIKPDTFPADHYVVDAAGTPKVIYGDGGEICCRGPFAAWSERMAEDLGKYPIDGVFLDGPVKDACWCPHCRAAFQAQFGRPLPDDTAAASDELRAQVDAFIAQMPVVYMKAFARGLHQHNPGAVMYCNGGDRRQMEATCDCTQLIGEEGGFIGYGPLNGEFPFGTGHSAKLMEHRSHGRARVVFCDPGYKVYDYYIHPKGEVARMYAGTLGNGASPWIGLHKLAIKSPGMQAVLRYNRLINEHREALADSQSLAEAAILHSPLNQYLAGQVQATSGDDVHKRQASAQRLAVPRHAEEHRGLYAVLTRSGYPFDVVEDPLVLDGQLPQRIKLLILPGVGAVSDAMAQRLREFVAAGGRLLATFDTSLFDEQGRRRADYALADVLGAHVEGEVGGPSGLDYFGIKARSALTKGVTQDLLPRPEYWWHIRAAASARPLLHYYEKMPRRYAALPPVSDQPAATLNKFGKGQVVFIPSALGQLSLQFRFPDIRVLLANAANMLARPPVTVEGGSGGTSGGEFIETTLRQSADGTVVVHLTNWASGERPSSGAIPLGPLRVTVRLPGGAPKPRTAQLGVSGRKARVTMRGNTATFVVPRIEEYEMAILSQ